MDRSVDGVGDVGFGTARRPAPASVSPSAGCPSARPSAARAGAPRPCSAPLAVRTAQMTRVSTRRTLRFAPRQVLECALHDPALKPTSSSTPSAISPASSIAFGPEAAISSGMGRFAAERQTPGVLRSRGFRREQPRTLVRHPRISASVAREGRSCSRTLAVPITNFTRPGASSRRLDRASQDGGVARHGLVTAGKSADVRCGVAAWPRTTTKCSRQSSCCRRCRRVEAGRLDGLDAPQSAASARAGDRMDADG